MFDFPNNPVVNQSVTAPNGGFFIFDGVKWTNGAGPSPTLYIPISGGVMTGPLTLAANATLPMHAVPLQQVLPLSGGTVTGPIMITATGGTVARSMQNRAADVANVLDYGADPTGVADSAPAINAAASQVAANGLNKAVYLPTGTYRVNSQINLTACQGMYGDSRGSSVLTVDQHFSTSATAVIMVTGGGQDAAPVLRDFGITFQQPPAAGTRSTYKTLAAGGTSVPGGTGVAYPWAIAAGNDSCRAIIRNMRIAGAWDGITTNNHNFIFQIDDLEMGALDIGISYGMGTAVLDQSHITNYHIWNFGLNYTAGQPCPYNVFADGQTIALQIGNGGSLDITGLEIFSARIVINDNTGRGDGAVHITNCMMDGDPSDIEVLSSMSHLFISNIYGSAGTARIRPFISINGAAIVRITNWYSHSSSAQPELSINAAADVIVTNFIANAFAPGTNWLLLAEGFCQILNGRFYCTSPRTAPLLNETGSGTLILDNIQVQGGPGAGPLITLTNVHPWTMLGKIALENGNSWTFSIPAGIATTFYSPATTFKGTVTTNGDITISEPSGVQKNLYFQRGTIPAWAVASRDAAENFAVLWFDDGGGYRGNALVIQRTNGSLMLPPLQASTTYANDAAAATGGVAVGQLYRNGSVVQVRVS